MAKRLEQDYAKTIANLGTLAQGFLIDRPWRSQVKSGLRHFEPTMNNIRFFPLSSRSLWRFYVQYGYTTYAHAEIFLEFLADQVLAVRVEGRDAMRCPNREC